MFRTAGSVGAILLTASLAASAQQNPRLGVSVQVLGPATGKGSVRYCPPMPRYYKLIAGGATVESAGEGLISSYPDGNCWHARAQGEASLKVWAIVLVDPKNEWDVYVGSNTVGKKFATFPAVTKSLDKRGYVLTGGGAKVEGSGFLVASWPTGARSWEAKGTASSTAVMSIILGIKPKAGAQAGLAAKIFTKSGTSTARAEVVNDGVNLYTLTGGGGRITSGSSVLSKTYADIVTPGFWEAAATEASEVEARAVGVTIGVR